MLWSLEQVILCNAAMEREVGALVFGTGDPL